jgi:uncharacterized protein (DUF4415 family)
MKRSTSSKASPMSSRRAQSARQGRAAKATLEHPEFDLRHVMRAVVRRGLKPVQPKASISLRLDADLLEWFKAKGPGYQTRINSILRAFKDAAA